MYSDSMSGYYLDTLSAEKLKRCYDIAPPRTKQYLDAEVNHVVEKIHPDDVVLELGCGYGRILPRLCQKARRVIGIDTSLASLRLARTVLQRSENCDVLAVDAVHLAFRDRFFDCVICIQNGISAFQVDQKTFMKESIRVVKSGGLVLISSYSNKFWKHRLEWFQLQAEAGLLGEIDYERTRDGIIVCRDGFKATTIQPQQFLSLTAELHVKTKIVEVDESSLFCEITVISDE
jgi:ubiquinone/menaquinone biosynthesis C-methylase UbiE